MPAAPTKNGRPPGVPTAPTTNIGSWERELAAPKNHASSDQNPPTEKHEPASPAVAAHQQTIQAEVQKQAARAPQTPTTHAPKNKPAPPGKPVWDKPHSS